MNRQIFTTALIAMACVALPGANADESEESISDAIRDFVEVRELAEVDAIATGSSDSWNELSLDFILYEGRRETYLVEFVRPCYELRDNTRITPDKRWDSNKIRAKFDTLRGCRLKSVYQLTEAEIAELESIGESPGSRL